MSINGVGVGPFSFVPMLVKLDMSTRLENYCGWLHLKILMCDTQDPRGYEISSCTAKTSCAVFRTICRTQRSAQMNLTGTFCARRLAVPTFPDRRRRHGTEFPKSRRVHCSFEALFRPLCAAHHHVASILHTVGRCVRPLFLVSSAFGKTHGLLDPRHSAVVSCTP